MASMVGRRALMGGAAAGVVALLGWSLLDDADGSTDPDRRDGPPLEGHPAATALGSQPTLGPSPTEADGTIVAFEDPSCPSCARFERETFPELTSQLVEPGRVSFVYRGIPVVREWGHPAVHALEAVHARDEAAFWSLKSFYYRSQRRIDAQNVRAETRRFLADETAVDATAVLDDVDQETYRDAVLADLGAADDAGVRGTPTFFLFRDGSYVTVVGGAQSYAVFENTLEM